MNQASELTVVLRARQGEHIGDLTPFLKPGSTVAVGRSGAVVSSVSAGNKIAHAEQLESQIVIAESAMRRGVQIPDDYAVVSQPQFDLDEHIRMVADARRYRWLRNVAFETPRQDLALRDKSGNMLIELDLDAEIDSAMQAYPSDFAHGEPV